MDIIEEVVNKIRYKMGENYTVNHKEVYRNNDTKSNAILILKAGEITSPQIYIDEILDKSVEEIAENVIKIYENNKSIRCKINNNLVEELVDFESIKNKLSIKLLNKNMNKKLTETVPYEEFLDLIIVACVRISDNMTTNVNNGLLEKWDKDFNEVVNIAKENCIKAGAVFKSMSETFKEMSEDIGIDDETFDMINMEEEESSMYVLTNKSKLYGAAFITNENLMNELCEKIGGDLLIVPSSVHEVLVLKMDKDVDIEYMNNMVTEVNETEVSPNEVLDTHCYIYRKETGWEW